MCVRVKGPLTRDWAWSGRLRPGTRATKKEEAICERCSTQDPRRAFVYCSLLAARWTGVREGSTEEEDEEV